jgi:hypothetical protein
MLDIKPNLVERFPKDVDCFMVCFFFLPFFQGKVAPSIDFDSDRAIDGDGRVMEHRG